MHDVPSRLSHLIDLAITSRASDIHIEPYPNEYRVRLRIDGLLYASLTFESSIASALINRIKVLSELDIAERRLPQDGSFEYHHYDIRVATFPSVHGEKMVLRLLNRSSGSFNLDTLGLSTFHYQQIQALLDKPEGFFLVTGPTGAGKTTTLQALLKSLNTKDKNAVTLEDPVEYLIEGVTQTKILPEIGLTFHTGLKTILRQDPDIIMIGEIRDKETARVALQASITGHLVLSSLHTSDAVTAFIRLIDMGIEPYLVAAGIKGILAQRLARRVCEVCKIEVNVTHEEQFLKKHGFTLEKYSSGQGCAHCNYTGYYGRIGIFQLLVMDEELRCLAQKTNNYDTLVNHAYSSGMKTLMEDGISKVAQGLITVSELIRVL